MILEAMSDRRYAIFAEGWFTSRHAKTAHGLMRYGKDEVVAVIDSTLAVSSVRDIKPESARRPDSRLSGGGPWVLPDLRVRCSCAARRQAAARMDVEPQASSRDR